MFAQLISMHQCQLKIFVQHEDLLLLCLDFAVIWRFWTRPGLSLISIFIYPHWVPIFFSRIAIGSLYEFGNELVEGELDIGICIAIGIGVSCCGIVVIIVDVYMLSVIKLLLLSRPFDCIEYSSKSAILSLTNIRSNIFRLFK